MYSILLVDDEKSIRDYLPRVLPFEEYGFRVAQTAANGQEGLEALHRVHPDLVLLDVRMPVLDGLAFLRRLRAEGDETLVVMLSGYSDFSYAKEAMRYGVRAYLNKPIDEEEAFPLLEELRRELDARRGEEIRQLLQRKMEQLGRLLDEELVAELPAGSALLVAVPLEGEQNPIPAESLAETIAQAAQECVETQVVFLRRRDPCLLFFLEQRITAERMEQLQEQLKKKRLDCALALLDSITAGWDVLWDVLLTCLFYKPARVYAHFPKFEALGERQEFQPMDWDALKEHVLQGDADAATRDFTFLSQNMERAKAGMEPLQSINDRLFFLLMDVLHSVHAPKESYPVHQLLHSTAFFLPFFQWKQRQRAAVVSVCQGVQRCREETVSGVCAGVLEFVHKHYMEQITLKQVAEKFFVNASYLGKAFQKATGESFKQYLNRLRLEQARRLLLQTDLRVYEVANAVGYPESKYFIAKFTEETGMSPSEFRGR